MSRREVVRLLLVGLVVAVVTFGIGYAAHPDTVAHVLPRTAEEWSAAGTWFAVFLAIIAAAIAYQQAAEARRLRLEQAQPYVVAYLEQLPSGPTIIELVIKNLGVTAARNVRIAVDRPLRRTSFRQPGTVEDVWLPGEPFFLAPGQEWRTTWDFATERYVSTELKDEDRHVMTLTYDGVEGTGRQETQAVLDLGPFKGRIYTEVKTTHHAAKQLEAIAKTLKGWSGRHALAVQHRDPQGASGVTARALHDQMRRSGTPVIPAPEKADGEPASGDEETRQPASD